MASRSFIDTDKFKNVVLSIEHHLVKQTGILEGISNLEKTRIEEAKETEEDRKRREQVQEITPEQPKQNVLSNIKSMLGVASEKIPDIGSAINIGMLAFAAPMMIDFANGFIKQMFTNIGNAMSDGSFWDGFSKIFGSAFGSILIGSAIFGPKKMLFGTFVAMGLLEGVNKALQAVGFDVNLDAAALAPIMSLIGNGLITLIGAKILGKIGSKALGGLFRGIKGVFTSGTKTPGAITTPMTSTKPSSAIPEGPPISTTTELTETAGKLTAAELSVARNVAIAEIESAVSHAITKESTSSIGEMGDMFGDTVKRLSGGFSSTIEPVGAYEDIVTGAKTLPTALAPSMIGASSKIGLGRRALGWLLGTPGLAAQFALDPSDIGLDSQEIVDTWIRRKFEEKGVGAIKEVQDFLKSDAGKTIREQFGEMYPHFNKLLDQNFARNFAIKTYDSPTNINKPKPATDIFYGDSNPLFNKIIKQFTTDQEGFSLSPSDIRLKLDTMRKAALEGTGTGATSSPVVVNGGNTTRGGDTYNNTSTVIMTNDPSKALNPSLLQGSR